MKFAAAAGPLLVALVIWPADAQTLSGDPTLSALTTRTWKCLETAYDAQGSFLSIALRTERALRECDTDVRELWEASAGRAEADRTRNDREHFMREFKALAQERLGRR